MNTNLHVVIVDDDRAIVELLESYVRMYTGLLIGYSGTDPNKAYLYVKRARVDVLFIDMEMPGLKGLDFLALVRERIRGEVPGMPPIHVVVCSAHRDYALDGYEHRITDFLLKPFSFPRFVESMDGIKRSLMVTPSRAVLTGGDEMFLVKQEGGSVLKRVDYAEIIYLEAMGNECKLWLGENDHLIVGKTLKRALGQLPREHFVRVHRSFAVAYDYIKEVRGDELKMNYFEACLPLGEKDNYPQFWAWVKETKW
ncbi:DNA-binding response regulator [Parapedobacter pyrenivorans]|uniref:DNA-binding response regulator n=1 Tax=Parapedobacter pyrenivorans TaxID=1305674 RepID=A0A917MD85_9SPHI|nr:LytTR family DNA-binding domain-containing protein [Parapedobacter pyrenivorans]GGG89820.1 DNA-binding response regulator [Parapedobacter pyrenivorans]